MPTIWIIAYVCLWLVVILEGLIIFYLINSLKKFVLKIQEGNIVEMKRDVPVNSLAPVFKVKDQFNNIINMGPNNGEDQLIVFISSTCSICKMLIENLDKINVQDRNIIFISEAPIKNQYINLISSKQYSFISSQQIQQDYNVYNVPKAVLISKKGYVQATLSINSWNDINSKLKNLA